MTNDSLDEMQQSSEIFDSQIYSHQRLLGTYKCARHCASGSDLRESTVL